MDPWQRLRDGLDALAEHAQPPTGGRLGAVLVLLRDAGGGDLELVYTRRREDLRSHPGQISFPGGRIDPGESPEQAAVREAVEEVGLDPASVELLGRLPAFYIPPSRFWLHAVVARWRAPHPLRPAEAEVAEVLHARSSRLCDPQVWRTVELSHGGHTWAWQLDERHLLWGATAVVTAAVLGIVDPDWSAGAHPATLAEDRRVRPWEQPRARPETMRRLPGVPGIPLEDSDARAGAPSFPDEPAARAAGLAVADAVELLVRDREGATRVTVLVGAGGNGAAGAAAAAALACAGMDVAVVTSRPPESLPALTTRLLDGLGPRRFDAVLPGCGVVVDALVGGGLRGAITGVPQQMVHALRLLAAPIVSVDLPSGVDPALGLVGDAVSADVTIALGGPREGLLRAGLEPFAGDLCLATEPTGRGPRLLRLERGVAIPRPGWRE